MNNAHTPQCVVLIGLDEPTRNHLESIFSEAAVCIRAGSRGEAARFAQIVEPDLVIESGRALKGGSVPWHAA
jgi:hypothetical protein